MASDRHEKTAQRYSRFSRSTYEDVSANSPSRAEEGSLTDITERALNGRRPPSTPAAHHRGSEHPQARSEGGRHWDHQPPPPDPSSLWFDEENPAPRESSRARPQAPNARPTMRDREAPAQGPASPRRHEEPQQAPPRHPAPRPSASAADAPAVPQADEPERHIRRTRQAAEKTGKQRRKAVTNAADGPSRTRQFVQAASTMRKKVAPALMTSVLWVAHNLRRSEIRKRYNRLLVLGHTRIVDRKLEELFFVPSRKSEMVDPAPERAIHYDGPVPSATFGWVMTLMPEDLRQFAFVDVRAGRGRASLIAAKWNFNRIMAYEYDPETFDDLEMNIAQYPRSRMTCRNIDCYRGDLDGIALPNQPCVIYFSGAWREQMIPGVMDYVRDTYRQSPRRIYVVLENTADDTALEQDNIFDPVEPSLAERSKLKLLSPMDFKIYRSLA